jgi:hypothetical protein
MWSESEILAAERGQAARRARSRIVVAIPLAIAALTVVLRFPAPAHAQPPMIQGWLAANTECKGGLSDDPKTQKACKRRDDLSAKLKRRGCVYQADGDWWKCHH